MPPPPPPPPPPLSSGGVPPLKTQSRAMLLDEIHQGTRLKKTVTNDRSAPVIEEKNNNSSASSSDMSRSPFSSFGGSLPKPRNIGSGGIAVLFANGIPRKPSEAKGMTARKDKSVVGTESTPVPKPPQLKPVGQQPHMPKPNSALKLAAPIVANKSVTSIATPLQSQSIKSKTSLPAAPANSTSMTVASISGTINKPSLPPTPQQHATASAYKPANTGTIQSGPGASRGPPKSDFMRRSPSHSSADQQSVRTESSEDIPYYKSIKRPAAPPPPPPGKSPSNAGPTPPQSLQQPPRPGFSGANPPPPPSIPINGLESAGPPQPPPRVSSYMESIEQRFHFLPMSELPPPPRFIDFQKLY